VLLQALVLTQRRAAAATPEATAQAELRGGADADERDGVRQPVRGRRQGRQRRRGAGAGRHQCGGPRPGGH